MEWADPPVLPQLLLPEAPTLPAPVLFWPILLGIGSTPEADIGMTFVLAILVLETGKCPGCCCCMGCCAGTIGGG